jgi:hypothetical protein
MRNFENFHLQGEPRDRNLSSLEILTQVSTKLQIATCGRKFINGSNALVIFLFFLAFNKNGFEMGLFSSGSRN